MIKRPGYTLLELIISISLILVIFIIVLNTVVNAFRDNRAQQSTLAATDRAQQIVRSTVSLIRQAETSPTGAYPLVAASANSINFYTAVPGSTNVQLVRIFVTGGNLQIGKIQPVGSPATYPAGQEVVTTILKGVANGSQPLFQYYDKNYTGTQSAMNPIVVNAIRIAKMTVIFDDNPSLAPGPSTIELAAQLRNLKDN